MPPLLPTSFEFASDNTTSANTGFRPRLSTGLGSCFFLIFYVFARRYNSSALTSRWGCGDDHVYGYADMLKALQNPDEDDDDDEREEYLNWMGREFDPEFFDLHELQNRVDDFQRVIGEARWGFYHR